MKKIALTTFTILTSTLLLAGCSDANASTPEILETSNAQLVDANAVDFIDSTLMTDDEIVEKLKDVKSEEKRIKELQHDRRQIVNDAKREESKQAVNEVITSAINAVKPEFILPGSELFELTALVPKDMTYHDRFDCTQSMSITDDGKIISFQWEWGQTNATRSSMFMVQEIDLESGDLLDTYYLPDCYDTVSETYVQNAYGGNHMHLNGSTYKDGKIYISDGSRVAVLDLASKSLSAVRLPHGMSAGAISKYKDGFAVRSNGSVTFLDSTLQTVTGQVHGCFNENQDFVINGDFAYSVEWREAENRNAVNVYDLNTGELVDIAAECVFTDSNAWTMEMEGIDFYNGEMYILFNSWGGAYENCVAKTNF